MSRMAAASGARKGAEAGKRLARAKAGREASEVAFHAEQRKQLSKQIMDSYDKDGGGSLGRKELRQMVSDYSVKMYKAEQVPTAEDLDFLIQICDRDGKGTEGKIDKEEVNHVTEVWGELMEQRITILNLIDQHDENSDESLEKEDLGEVLQEMENGEEVPAEVVDWIFKTADISGNGKLSGLEVARALCALEAWKQHRSPNAPAKYQGIGKNIKVAEDLPPKSSACCTVQ